MRVSLGVALFIVLSGVALFGVGLARADAYYIASGLSIFFLGTLIAAIILGKCTGINEVDPDEGTDATTTTTTNTTASRPVQSTNPVMKKNKSDTDLELMGNTDE